MFDLLLAAFVDMVDKDGGSCPVTLTIGGVVITGHLVSRREFLRNMAVDFHKAVESASPGSGGFWLDLEEMVARMPEGQDVEADHDNDQPPILHLKNARTLLANGQLIPENGAWWRGRPDRVDGFWFGTLQSSSVT